MSAAHARRIHRALARLDSRLAPTPALRRGIFDWLARLSPSGQPADYFLPPRTLPTWQLPVWVEASLGVPPDPALQDDLAYASLVGYCHIRLIDDVMDRDPAAQPALLPATSFFHAEFQGSFRPYFDARHGFWPQFERLWYQAAEATCVDAGLASLSLDQFLAVAALKVSAAKIPIVATCLHHGRAEALPHWIAVADRLGAIAQMTDDLLDWQDDLATPGRVSYFLSEAHRRRGGASTAVWILGEGFAWGVQTLQSWYGGIRSLTPERPASTGHEPVPAAPRQPLHEHLDAQEQMLLSMAAERQAVHAELAGLGRVWPV